MIREKHIDSLLQPRQLNRVYTRIANNSAFTLIELVVVVVIIMILATLAVFGYSKFVGKAQVISAISEVKNIATDIKIYVVEGDSLPVQNPGGDIGNVFPNIIINDPWGRPYQYSSPPFRTRPAPPGFINTEYDIYSLGKDGLTNPDISHSDSLDDIIRAGDGQYLGKASGY